MRRRRDRAGLGRRWTDRTRQQLLDAAITVFSRRGFARATTREIAEAAGVAEGAIYRHYPDKQALFCETFSTSNPFSADECMRLPEPAGKETVHEDLCRFMSVIGNRVRTTAPL
jgi:transcription initiation factor TFIIIB Brf1 subunit/transcription initiation factor TFIIB